MKGRVLVVDNDPQIREVLEMRLEALGLAVTAVAGPREALAALDAGGFDLALFDLKMEPMDGIALMETAHQRLPGLPVLIMTAHGSIEDAVAAIQRGAFDYLTKPFLPDELRARVGQALSERRWARDRGRLKAVGETLASSGVMERILDAVAQATVEATEAERSVVFLLEGGQAIPMASAGTQPKAWEPLQAAAAAAVEKGVPTTLIGAEGRVALAAPLVVKGGPVGALVVECPERVAPTPEDLELLALFSFQAAVALKNAHELSQLRSGALAALGRMAAQVAHELKNPLGGLKLYARHLEKRLAAAPDPELGELAQKIGRAIDHLANLVTEITAFGRPAELKREPVNVVQLLDECLALCQDRLARRHIRVSREYAPDVPVALLDPRELRKVFLNLLLNALEAMGDEGTLSVTVSHRPEEGMIQLTIEDSGCGMSEETLSRVFDLFFTTKPHGTGLGMAIARSVVDLHGGRIQIESRPGEGTRVHVLLPVRHP
ncbi:MAG: response regulator [Candidatus Rokubacteria bacterium]|nr:response regulator [Candidatus Rokubacteria bacterium]